MVFECLIRCEEAIGEDSGVEFEFVAGDGVDKGEDDFEEEVDEGGDVDDEGDAEAFGVVGLDDVEDL